MSIKPGIEVLVTQGLHEGRRGRVIAFARLAEVGVKMFTVELYGVRTAEVREDFMTPTPPVRCAHDPECAPGLEHALVAEDPCPGDPSPEPKCECPYVPPPSYARSVNCPKHGYRSRDNERRSSEACSRCGRTLYDVEQRGGECHNPDLCDARVAQRPNDAVPSKLAFGSRVRFRGAEAIVIQVEEDEGFRSLTLAFEDGEINGSVAEEAVTLLTGQHPEPTSNKAPTPALPIVERGLRFLLSRIGSWTNARFDQHLRYEFGDEQTDEIMKWLEVYVSPKLGKARNGLPHYMNDSHSYEEHLQRTEPPVPRPVQAHECIDLRCPECGQMMTEHVLVTRHANSACPESFTGPPIPRRESPSPEIVNELRDLQSLVERLGKTAEHQLHGGRSTVDTTELINLLAFVTMPSVIQHLAPRRENPEEDAYRNGFRDALNTAALMLVREGRRSSANRDALYAKRGAELLREMRDRMMPALQTTISTEGSNG